MVLRPKGAGSSPDRAGEPGAALLLDLERLCPFDLNQRSREAASRSKLGLRPTTQAAKLRYQAFHFAALAAKQRSCAA